MDNSKVKRNIKPFDGDKYSVWKLRIRNLLNELDVLKVIDEEPPMDPDVKWLRKERIAKNTIVEYLADSLLGLIKEDNSAREIFSNLDSIYARKSIATQLALRKKLLNLKLEEEQSLIQHFQNFEDLQKEIVSSETNNNNKTIEP